MIGKTVRGSHTPLALVGSAISIAVTLVATALGAPAAQAAHSELGIASFFAANCEVETCKAVPPEEALEKAESEDYVQAAGHPPFGVTDFTVASQQVGSYLVPEAVVTHARVNIAPGVVTNPEAVAQCPLRQFGEHEVVPTSGLYPAPRCEEETEIGENKVLVYIEQLGVDLPLSGPVYNLEQPPGLASDFGVALPLPKALTEQLLVPAVQAGLISQEASEGQFYAHTLIEGNVEWAGAYNDYFEIDISPALPLISSRLIFDGDIGNTGVGAFLTNPSRCGPAGPATTNSLVLRSASGESASATYITPVGIQGCDGAAPFLPVPFSPGFDLNPETTASDAPDGIETTISVPHPPSPAEIDSSQVSAVTVTLPEGMTLNPSAAKNLQVCTAAEFGMKTRRAISCPGASQIGSVALNVPTLPDGSLQGHVYLGGSEPIAGPPYTIYLDATSHRYGVSVRLAGTATPDPSTGRLTVSFPENPEQPFSKLTLALRGGALAPIANPLACGSAATGASIAPYTGAVPAALESSFAVRGCSSPLPFDLAQSTPPGAPAIAGAHPSFMLALRRADGQQYLSTVSTALPLGLSAKIASVPLCPEAQAAAGTCPEASRIGTATSEVGAGPEPYSLTGAVYLTGPYQGAPYGLSIATEAKAGPFDLGMVVVRARITVDPGTARVSVQAPLPQIVGGIPLRIKGLTVTIDRPGFIYNPTSCQPLATESTLTSTTGAADSLASPYQVSGCSSLKFKPSLTAKTRAAHSRKRGAYLHVTVRSAKGESNIREVRVKLPRNLPVRNSTLKDACAETQFAADPMGCPKDGFVGNATARTPLLAKPLRGPAIYVSHGGRSFPDLDIVLKGDGITVILVGNTFISNRGVITSTFKSVPDVPVSQFDLVLPQGKHSALSGVGNLCYRTKTVKRRVKLRRKGHVVRRNGHIVHRTRKIRIKVKRKIAMPTVIAGHSGAVIKKKTKLKVTGCNAGKGNGKKGKAGKGGKGKSGKARKG